VTRGSCCRDGLCRRKPSTRGRNPRNEAMLRLLQVGSYDAMPHLGYHMLITRHIRGAWHSWHPVFSSSRSSKDLLATVKNNSSTLARRGKSYTRCGASFIWCECRVNYSVSWPLLFKSSRREWPTLFILFILSVIRTLFAHVPIHFNFNINFI